MRPSPQKISAFRRAIWSYYRRYARRMPWRETRDPYRILVSEYMLQQTQVDRVVLKYQSFLKRFPMVTSLARAPLTDILREWQGLGYNRRGVYLKRAAEEIVARHSAAVPRDPEALARLPGIGPGTAGAIAAFAFQYPSVFIETNVRRVFIHFFFSKTKHTQRHNIGATIGTGTTDIRDKEILSLVGQTVSRRNPREWYYALMDYGAMLAKHVPNPNRLSRHYIVQSRFEGSNRQLRGKVLAAALAGASRTPAALAKKLGLPLEKVKPVYNAMRKEGILPWSKHLQE